MFTKPHKTQYTVNTNQILSINIKTMGSLIDTGGGYHIETSTQHSQDNLLAHEKEALHTSGTYHLSSTDGYQLSIAYIID
jgi:hypothetical protein